jgi:hypothetical protein
MIDLFVVPDSVVDWLKAREEGMDDLHGLG